MKTSLSFPKLARPVLPALTFLLCLALPFPALAAELFVAPAGNDASPGTKNQPFATLERARDEVRKIRAAGAREAVTVFLRGGLYQLPQGFKLEARDGGTPEAPVTWRAFEKETPILAGGRAITGFTPYRGQIVKANAGAQGFKGIAFRQLIFDGRRQPLARHPNFDPQNPYGGGWAYADGKLVPMYSDIPGEDRHTFTLKPQDLREWSRPGELQVMVFARYNWWNDICPVKSIDRATRRVTLGKDASYAVRPGDRYYIENAFEELDAPGEWWLDKSSGTLYFWPPAPLEGRTVMAPTTESIIEINGADSLTLRSLTFECSEGTAIQLRDTKNCMVAACTIRNVGHYRGSGVAIDDGVRNGVVGCDIHDTGSNAIAITGGDRIKLIPAENYADNNYLHHFGVYYKQGVGVALRGVGNRASHNLMHDGPRMGIMFSGNNLLIEYNHIRHVNLETEDTGAVYTGGRDWLGSRGTVIRYNYFHDMLGYGHDAKGEWHSPFFAWGVYLDDNTGGVDVIGNLVLRCPRAGLHLHNGRDNKVENNIFLQSSLQQIEFSGWTPAHRYWTTHLPTMIQGYESVMNEPAWRGMRNMNIHPKDAVLPDGTIMSGNEIVRNIIAYSDPKAKYVQLRSFSFDHNKVDENLVWHEGLPLLTGQFASGKPVSGNLAPNPEFDKAAPGGLPADWSWQVRPSKTAKAEVADGALRIEAAFVKEKPRDNTPIVASRGLPLQPGHSYRVSAKMKATQAGATASLLVHAYLANVFYWGSSPNRITAGPEWKDYAFDFRIPAPGEPGYHEKMKDFRISIGYPDKTGALMVKNVSLVEVETMNEWAAWQSKGMDAHSIVADPLFVNPQKDDYRLRPESPALKLGFKPLPLEKIGPYADELRASWPIVEAEGAREKPLTTELKK